MWLTNTFLIVGMAFVCLSLSPAHASAARGSVPKTLPCTISNTTGYLLSLKRGVRAIPDPYRGGLLESKRLEDLGALVAGYRRSRKLSLRKAAEETGIAFNTLARIERGFIPDLETFRRVSTWIGMSPAEFFEKPGGGRLSTPELIAAQLKADPALSDDASERIARIIQDLYGALATPRAAVAVHLRAAKALRPEAARCLGSLLADLRDAFDREQP
jgi:transcriptional regulator with XRE-family HTH domain